MDTLQDSLSRSCPATATPDRHWSWIATVAIADHRAQHDPAELAALLSFLAHDPQLRHVLEIGAGMGGSAWAWSQLPRVRSVVSVSLDPSRLWQLPPGTDVLHRCIPADSTLSATVAEVRACLPGSGYDLLVIDGGHTESVVRADWHNYAPMVRPGGLVVLHDTRDGEPADQLQVSRLWRELAGSRATIELHANPDGPAGTGIVLA